MDEILRKQNKKIDYRDPKVYLPYHNKTIWKGVSWPSTLEDLNTIEENNEDIAINVLLAPADKNDEIVKKRNRKEERNERRGRGGRKIPENVKPGKFEQVLNVSTIRTSKKNGRSLEINLLMIHKVCIKKYIFLFKIYYHIL